MQIKMRLERADSPADLELYLTLKNQRTALVMPSGERVEVIVRAAEVEDGWIVAVLDVPEELRETLSVPAGPYSIQPDDDAETLASVVQHPVTDPLSSEWPYPNVPLKTPNCPWCGTAATFAAGTALCYNSDCQALTWDPTVPASEQLADPQFITGLTPPTDLNPDAG